MVEADPKVGSAEIAKKLAAEFGVSVTAKTVRNAVQKHLVSSPVHQGKSCSTHCMAVKDT